MAEPHLRRLLGSRPTLNVDRLVDRTVMTTRGSPPAVLFLIHEQEELRQSAQSQ